MIEFTANGNWECRLNTASRQLETRQGDGMEVSCQLSQPEVRLLQLLLSEPGTVRSRDDLIKFAWGRRPVTQNSLNHAIFNLRQAFGPRDGREIIVTVPNEGYLVHARLLGEISVAEEPAATEAAAEPPPAQATYPEPIPPQPTRRPRGLRLSPGGRKARLLLSLPVLNLAIVGVLWLLPVKQDAPLVDYQVIGEAQGLTFHAQRATPLDASQLEREIQLFLEHPPQSGKGRRFVYLNGTGAPGQHYYFVCQVEIQAAAPNCGAYAVLQEGQP